MKAALAILAIAAGALLTIETMMQPTAGDRVTFILIFGGAALLSVVAGIALPRMTWRFRSLRTIVLLTSVSAAVLVSVVVSVAASLMFLSSHDLRVVLIALAMSIAFGIVLSTAIANAFSRDLELLRARAHAVGAGSEDVRTSISRRDELGELARAFDAMTAKLAEATEARERTEAAQRSFLAAISHDLRTPLTAMRVALEALEDGMAPDPDRYLRAMSKDVEVLSRLVDDVFLLSRIEAGRLDIEPETVDIAELVDEAIEAMQPVADRSQVRLRLKRSGASLARGGSAELGRVVRNLLDNAIRWTPEGSQVDVSVGRDNGSVTVSVSDEGPGFPAAFRPEALREFTRADVARARSHGGAGLGLAIARGLVTAHGGSLELGNGPGATVTFAIPASD